MSDRVRRIAAVVVLAVVGAGAIVLAGRDPESRSAAAAARQPVDGPTVPSEDAVSSVWYCAEGTSAAAGRARETVIIGNLEARPIDVAVTVMPGGDAPPLTESYELVAYEQRRVEVAGIAEALEPGVVVEAFGGRAVVEHEIQGFRDDVAVGPCARTASTHWYFAEGSTERGAQDWLALFNPFGDDAIVDVTFVDDGGLQSPEGGQAIVVPRRSRVSLPIHDVARRQGQLGVSVQARSGRIVAERSGFFDGTDTRTGVTLALGATGGATRWRFPILDTSEGTAESVSVANFTEDAAQVEVRVLLDGVTALPPETVRLTGNAIQRIDVGARANTGEAYAVEVTSVNGTPVVAGAFGAWAAPSPVTGVATTQGSAFGSVVWAFAVGRLDADGEAVISALNVSGRALTVQLYAYTRGDPQSPASAPAEALPPGERASFSLGERDIGPDQVIVVRADGPIVVGREVLGPGASIAPGVPFTPLSER